MEHRIRELFMRALQGAENLFYPRAACCLICGDPRRAELADGLCDRCRRALQERRLPPQACSRCLMPVGKGGCRFCASPMMQPLEAVYAPYRFGGEVRQLVHAFKFNACDEALPILCGAMADSLTRRDFDCLVPVPLHPRRLRQRGFNQALLLCRELSLRTGIPVREMLRRTVYHRPQSRTRLSRRKANVSRAFSCPEDAAGLRVLLVDDVRTTGSTAHACAQALKNAGAESVSLWVSAVVYRKPGEGRKK